MAEADPINTGMIKMLRACIPVVDERLSEGRGEYYFPLTSLFDQVSGDQFLDQFGHVTEQANALIASAITEQLIPILQPLPKLDVFEDR